jgi:hypothetical protein
LIGAPRRRGGAAGPASATGPGVVRRARLQALLSAAGTALPFGCPLIVFRGDSGFCRQLLFNTCERSHVHYIIGLARNGWRRWWSMRSWPCMRPTGAAAECSA